MSTEITIRALNPCIVETLAKDFDGVRVEAERLTFDKWLDVWIDLPDGVDLPSSGSRQFSLREIATDYEIQETSDDCDIECSVTTDIDDPDLADEIEEVEENEDWDDWIETDSMLLITDYKII